MILYRPVGQRELDLVQASGWTAFPPRLPEQPTFYPVCNENYATRIAREWNAKDRENGCVGYVTRFEVDDSFMAGYERKTVGDAECVEYWIPADDLEQFNSHILGTIEVVSEWRGSVEPEQ